MAIDIKSIFQSTIDQIAQNKIQNSENVERYQQLRLIQKAKAEEHAAPIIAFVNELMPLHRADTGSMKDDNSIYSIVTYPDSVNPSFDIIHPPEHIETNFSLYVYEKRTTRTSYRRDIDLTPLANFTVTPEGEVSIYFDDLRNQRFEGTTEDGLKAVLLRAIELGAVNVDTHIKEATRRLTQNPPQIKASGTGLGTS